MSSRAESEALRLLVVAGILQPADADRIHALAATGGGTIEALLRAETGLPPAVIEAALGREPAGATSAVVGPEVLTRAGDRGSSPYQPVTVLPMLAPRRDCPASDYLLPLSGEDTGTLLVAVPAGPVSAPPLPPSDSFSATRVQDDADTKTQIMTGSELAAAPPLPAVLPAETPVVGRSRVFGRYRLLARLGGGGMGEVFRALDPQLGREVALKVTRTDFVREEMREQLRRRFLQEVAAMARLHHPNILPVFDSGQEGESLYYTMELHRGESFDRVIRRMKNVPPRAALRVVRDAARALQHAHENGIVHRDVKPANILLAGTNAVSAAATQEQRAAADSALELAGASTSAYRVHIMDFGLAREIAGSSLTQTGAILGTPHYMSPEQAGADPGIGPLTDVYSLGVTLYEALSGKPPLDGENEVELLHRILRTEPLPLCKRLPALAPDIATICEKAMAKDPARRYESAGALAEDIERCLKGELIRARPASFAYRLWRTAVVHRAAVVPFALAVLLVAGVLAAPGVARAWRGRAARLEREARERDSAALLARARRAAGEGQGGAGGEGAAAAVSLATRLVEKYGAFAEAGEGHPIPEAEGLLADLLAARGDGLRALRHRFLAYGAATRQGRGAEWALAAARALVEEGRPGEAVALLRRLPGCEATDPLGGEVLYWLGRGLEGEGNFAEALAVLRAAAAGPLAAGLRADCEEQVRLSDVLAGEAVLPLDVLAVLGVDLDGDGRKELVAASGEELFVGEVTERGVWRERGRFALGKPGAAWKTVGLEEGDVDGDGRPEVLVVTSGATSGQLRILRWGSGGLSELASVDSRGEVGGHPLCVSDLDRDGDPEIVLGTCNDTRRVSVFRWRRAAGKLDERLQAGMGNDVAAVRAWGSAPDRPGRVLALLGGYELLGLRLLEWERGELVARAELQLGLGLDLVELEGGAEPELVVGVSWPEIHRAPRECWMGEDAFRAQTRASGVYRIRLRSSGPPDVEPLVGGSWEKDGGKRYRVASFRRGDARWLWVGQEPESSGGLTGEAGTADASVEVLVRSDQGWKRLGRLQASARWVEEQAAGIDLDGDGEDELVSVVRPAAGGKRSVLVRGLAGARARGDAAGTPAVVEEGAGGAPRVSGTLRGAAPALDEWGTRVGLGFDAEALGLWADALELYRAVLDAEASASGSKPPSPSALLDAERGALRALAELGRDTEVVREARAAVARWPGRERDLLASCRATIERRASWGAAADLAALEASAPGADANEDASAAERADRLRALATMGRRVALSGAGAAELDWLVSSPFAVEWDGKRLRFNAPAALPSFIALPLELTGRGQELSARVHTQRMDAGCSSVLAIAAGGWGAGGFGPWETREGTRAGGGGPMAAIGLEGLGVSDDPVRRVTGRGRDPAGSFGRPLLSVPGGLPPPLAVSTAAVPYPDRWLGRVSWGSGEATGEMTETREASGPTEMHSDGGAFAVIFGGGRVVHGGWAVTDWSDLAFSSADRASGPVAFTPVRALEHLALANGRWVFGRLDDAARLYDLAVGLADAEFAKEDRLMRWGLPSAWRASAWDAPEPVAATDARFYRGLFRWSRGDRKGGMADLLEVWRRNRARMGELEVAFGPALLSRPREAEALRELWLEALGRPEGMLLEGAVQNIWEASGGVDELVEALFGPLGFQLRRRTKVKVVLADSPAARAGLRVGDRIVSYGGRELRRGLDFGEARYAAARLRPAPVRLVLLRGKERLEVELPANPFEQGLEVQDFVRVVRPE
ncbi:MAG: protein kinase [Planctomycetes bacterium]|nr:protein kinase [Planctomycetota bacterium]